MKMVHIIGPEEFHHKARIGWQETEEPWVPGSIEDSHFHMDDLDSNPGLSEQVISLGPHPSAVKHQLTTVTCRIIN